MGEYVLLDGQPHKLGTCEDLYHCRYADFAQWLRAGRVAMMRGNEEPASYLAGGYRFRFPFPDEDSPAEPARLATYGAEYDRGVLLPYPRELLPVGLEHNGVTALIAPQEGRHKGPRGYVTRATFRAPCPLAWSGAALAMETLAAGWGAMQRYEDRGPWVELVQQRPVDGQLMAVFRCPWCVVRWRATAEDAARIAAYALETAPELPLDETLRRLLAGYEGLPAGGA